MNVYAMLAAGLVYAAIVGGAYVKGEAVGRAAQVAEQSAVNDAVKDTREAALQGAAEAISKIKITNTTVRGEVQREVQTNTIYRDCKLPADGLRIANDAIAGQRTQPAGGGKLSTTPAAGQ